MRISHFRVTLESTGQTFDKVGASRQTVNDQRGLKLTSLQHEENLQDALLRWFSRPGWRFEVGLELYINLVTVKSPRQLPVTLYMFLWDCKRFIWERLIAPQKLEILSGGSADALTSRIQSRSEVAQRTRWAYSTMRHCLTVR